ncbi:sugar ABC transporter ATP-binding protein [Microbacterium sp. ET2]|uniref:sugar ABC transporter ATP-binding protein n=1 Tax=Microbacterium albipurpureum TaxID=3050384 RepID=UPI00259CC02D|nr:sugar ABC transporter ATP-binding protein [Microbacterium sp. ET2 (Ac-2212)]WJL96560.1 sugar ABC transporter ATP-binding protein [Microbacterium sp. ET2 (Ac-2212)]
MDERRPLLTVTGATVRFGAEVALDDVDFRVFPGEVHSLMGENGAGKSTLIKAITGALQLHSGTISLDGRAQHFPSTAAALGAGISAVYQEIDLLPNLTIAENICLGREPRRWGVIDRRALHRRAAAVLQDLGVSVDPASILGGHSLAVQQLVALARAISVDARILILDEPTSSLDVDEVTELFRVIDELKARDVAIVFISHFLDQVYEIADRITVLRNGRQVGEYVPAELLRIDLVQKMLGRTLGPLTNRASPEDESDATVAYLSARGVTASPGIMDADLELHEGEVLGLAGLLGSGRTELARAVSGIDRIDHGVISVGGRPADFRTPRHAIAQGVVYSSENRRTDGIIGHLSVQENITLALQAERGAFRPLSAQRRRELATSWIEALDIRPADPDRPAGALSGGNQQKVLLARLLALSPRALLLDEPTRGIDVGAKVEIQNLVSELADNGLSVVFISAELEEVLRVANRVAVLRNGRIVATVSSETVTVDSLLALVAQADGPDGAPDEPRGAPDEPRGTVDT